LTAHNRGVHHIWWRWASRWIMKGEV
jgi:hypothetical protein